MENLDRTDLNTEKLNQWGLNIQAVLSLAQLPDSLTKTLKAKIVDLNKYTQIILLGHQGKQLWENVKEEINKHENPIDQYTVRCIQALFNSDYSNSQYQIIYPGKHLIDLQSLGKLVGWHFESPFRVGVHPQWGSWFAYRAAILADTNFTVTNADSLQSSPPCENCTEKPCIQACPASACTSEHFDLQKCIRHRIQPNSNCEKQCLARNACPVGVEHQYSRDQINYHYSVSIQMIKAFTL